MISENLKTSFFILSIYFFGLKFFQSTPIEATMSVAHFLFLILMGSLVFLKQITKTQQSKGLNFYSIYFLSFIFIVPLWSMFRSNIALDQPYYYGFLSERGWLVICSGIVLHNIITSNPNRIKLIENLFIKFAFITLFIYSFIYLTFDLSQYEEYKFVSESDLRGYRLKLNIFFINFGIIYSLIKFFDKKSVYNFFLFLVFFIYTLFVVQGRAHLLQIFLICTIYFIMNQYNYSFARRVSNTTLLIFSTFFIFFFLFLLNPDFISNLVFSITQLFTVIGGNISYDASANSRIVQAIIAFDVINQNYDNLWFGVGKISKQWGYNSDGLSYLFGHFYPADIGILGGVFQYGLLGLFFLWFIPIVICFKIIKKVPISHNNRFIVSLKFLLIFYIISSFNTGNFFFTFQEIILIMYILLAFIDLENASGNTEFSK